MPKKVSKTYHKNVNAKDIRIWKKWQKRTKVLAVGLLVVALGAGGYWAYKSFAATVTSAYTVGNGYLQPGTGGSVTSAGSSKGKSGEQVIMVPNGVSVNVGTRVGDYIRIPAGQKFRYCITESGFDLGAGSATTINSADVYDNASSTIDHQVPFIGGYFGGGTTLKTNIAEATPLANNYVKYCNQPSTRSHDISGPLYINFRRASIPSPTSFTNVTFDKVEPKLVYVSAFYIDFVN